eukprot:scaffold15686_cov30-Tisochrysis_lutea.AAC.4
MSAKQAWLDPGLSQVHPRLGVHHNEREDNLQGRHKQKTPTRSGVHGFARLFAMPCPRRL